MYQASRPRRNEGGTPFRDWIRHQPGLESNTRVGFVGTDLDLVWYNYLTANLMLLEEKRGTEEYSLSQRTTLSVLDQSLHFALDHPGFTLRTPKTCRKIPRKIRYWGVHVIRFEHSTPDDGRVQVDGIPISKESFRRFLMFDAPIMERLNLGRLRNVTSIAISRYEPLTVDEEEEILLREGHSTIKQQQEDKQAQEHVDDLLRLVEEMEESYERLH